VNDAYRIAGFTYFSVESRLKYLREILAGENIKILTRVLGTIEKKLLLLHQLQTEDGTIAATCEATLIHVDLDTRASCLPSADVVTRLAAYAASHEPLKQTLD
jgi:carnitine 3-dehydrogenase